MKLTEHRIEGLTVEGRARDRLVFDDEQRGLAVRITAGGGKSYLCQYSLHGRKWRIPLGACQALSLARARRAAAAILGDVARGVNPFAERRKEIAAERARRARESLTLETLIDDWQRLHLTHRRPRYRDEATRAIKYAFDKHLDRPAEDLARVDVVRAIDSLTGQGTGRAIASRTAAYGRAMYAWAVKRGAVGANPFIGLPAIEVVKRERVLSDDEIGKIWRATFDSTVSPAFASIVRLLLLSGQRRDEIARMAWDELSPDRTTLILAGTRTKNRSAHVIPLNKPAQDEIKKLEPSQDEMEKLERGALVLPGAAGKGFAGWSKAKIALDAAIAKAGTALDPWRLHDLRRTVATNLQRLGVRLEVTEAVLGHVAGSRAGIVGVYQRHDWAAEKRAALEAWGSHVMALVGGQMTGNVVKLAR